MNISAVGVGGYWLKSAQEFLSSLVIFLALGGQPLPIMIEKSPFVSAACFSKSHTVPIYYTEENYLFGF